MNLLKRLDEIDRYLVSSYTDLASIVRELEKIESFNIQNDLIKASNQLIKAREFLLKAVDKIHVE